MAEEIQEFNFLESYIHQLLDEHGFEGLTEETRDEYLPQFVGEAQRRIGLAVLPKLDEAAAKELAELVKAEDVTPEKLRAFWEEKVPDFESIVKETLDAFSVEFAKVMSGLAK